MTSGSNDHWRLFDPKVCNVRLKGADKDSVLEELVQALVGSGALEDAVLDKARVALAERERTASTGIGRGVAIPHVQVEGLAQPVVSLSVHPEGVDWGALDREPVHIFFMVLRPDRPGELFDPERHLELMRWIASLAQDSDFLSFALGLRTKRELTSLLREMAGR